MKKVFPFLFSTLFAFSSLVAQTEKTPSIPNRNIDDKDFNSGVTVTPSHIDFTADMGETQVKKIKITNYTSKTRKFSVNYSDFDISTKGKSVFPWIHYDSSQLEWRNTAHYKVHHQCHWIFG